jgi:hypothetical protein
MSLMGSFGDNSSGGGFPDAFAGNQGIMLTQALQSENFVSGVSGWQILRNGNAQFNNGVFRGSVEVTSVSGQDILIGVNGSISEIEFLSGVSYEKTPANFAEGVTGAGASQQIEFLMSGPQAASPNDDWVQIVMVSNSSGGGNEVVGELVYVDVSGTPHDLLVWGIAGGVIGIQLNSAEVNGTINGINLTQVSPPSNTTPNSGDPSTPQSLANLYNWANPVTTNINGILSTLTSLISQLISAGVLN